MTTVQLPGCTLIDLGRNGPRILFVLARAATPDGHLELQACEDELVALLSRRVDDAIFRKHLEGKVLTQAQAAGIKHLWEALDMGYEHLARKKDVGKATLGAFAEIFAEHRIPWMPNGSKWVLDPVRHRLNGTPAPSAISAITPR